MSELYARSKPSTRVQKPSASCTKPRLRRSSAAAASAASEAADAVSSSASFLTQSSRDVSGSRGSAKARSYSACASETSPSLDAMLAAEMSAVIELGCARCACVKQRRASTNSSRLLAACPAAISAV